ncbi:MAG: PEP-utilizing enzyme [Candidatus Sifarchaeia archaeon]|jgi:pyruvate,water dikinase
MTNKSELGFPIEWQSEEDKKEVWSRKQIADRYPDPVTPLFADVWFSNLGPAIKRMGDTLNILKKGFIPRYVIFNGYAYGNLDPRNMSKLKLVRLLFQLYHKAHYTEKNYKAEMEVPHLRRVVQLQSFDLKKASIAELDSHLSRLEKTFEDWMVSQNITFFFTEIAIKIFGVMTRLLFGKSDTKLYLKLTAGFENESVIMNREMARLATLVRNNKNKILFEKYSGIELLRKIKPERSLVNFRKEFNVFLDSHGIRTTHWDFVYPTWKEAPEIVLDLIKGFVADPAKLEDKLKAQKSERKNAIKTIKLSFQKSFWKRPLQGHYFKWMDLAQRYTILKERRQVNMYKVWYPIRLTVQQIGKRLLKTSVVGKDSDTFFLRRKELSEIIAVLKTNKVTLSWEKSYKDLIDKRREAWSKQFELEPPIIMRRGSVTKVKKTQKGKELKGTPASAGVAISKSNIILTPRELGEFRQGDILVTKYTNPSWTPLFGSASGVVTEAGGVLSHAAIVAREYSIPAVVGLHKATKLIKNQEIITVDGNSGVVSKNLSSKTTEV